MYGIVAAAAISAIITALLSPVVRRWSVRRKMVDQPGERRVNTAPMPRGGGLAIFAGILVATALTITIRQFARLGQHTWNEQVVGVLVAIAFVAVVGFIDDLLDLSAKWQTAAILAAGFILMAFGVRIEGITNPLGPGLGTAWTVLRDWHELSVPLSIFVTLVWVFVVTKTVDAIDGVDGLAAGVCAISAATLALMSAQLHTNLGPTLALMAAAVLGACLGFLRDNYHPAKIIMGTSGAWVLGFTLASISILGAFKFATAVSVAVPILVLGVPILDYTHVLTRRALEGAPLTHADKRHLHHRLLARGWTQPQVVWFVYSLTALLCVAALVLFRASR